MTERVFARLVRFYGIAPAVILDQPGWVNDLLVRHMDAIQAEELLADLNTGSLPYMEKQDQRRLIHTLERMANQGLPSPAPEPPAIEEYNPDKAREYFESLGATVK